MNRLLGKNRYIADSLLVEKLCKILEYIYYLPQSANNDKNFILVLPIRLYSFIIYTRTLN